MNGNDFLLRLYVDCFFTMHISFRCNKKISSSYLKPDYTITVEGTDDDHLELLIIEVKVAMRNRCSKISSKSPSQRRTGYTSWQRRGEERTPSSQDH